MVRPRAFMDRLRSLAGTMIADYRLKGVDIVRRANLTISVTGTATYEAFLLGRPALALGRGLAANCLGGVAPIGKLTKLIRERLDNPLSDAWVVERVAELLSVRYDFYPYASVGYPGEPTLRAGNIARMLDAIIDHIARDSAAQDSRVITSARECS